MSKFQKIINIIGGIVLLLVGLIMVLFPEDGLIWAILLLSITLIVSGIQRLIYYFSLARHMVGGKWHLYLGAIIFDMGLLTLSLSQVPHIYIVAYLVAVYAFTGVISILRAFEAKKYAAPSYKLNLISGVIFLLIAIASVVFIKNTILLVYFYTAGLFYAAVTRIVTAFRKTAIIYVP